MFFERHLFGDRELPIYFQHQTRTDREPKYDFHWHETPEFIYVTDGVVEIRVNDSVEHFSAGDFVYIAPQFSHCFRAVGEECSYYCLIPDNSILSAGGVIAPGVCLARVDDSEVKALYLNIAREWKEKAPCYQAVIKADIVRMTAVLNRHRAGTIFPAESVDDNAMRIAKDAIQYMEEHYAEKIGGEDVASALGISRSYLCHMIQRATRQTLTENLLCIRCRKARELLWAGVPTGEVVWRTGFSSASHFSRTYRKIMGVLPSAQRRKKSGTSDFFNQK